MERSIRAASALSLVLATSLVAQATPPVRDTVRRDSTRFTALPAIRSEATRIERQIFDQAPNVGHLDLFTGAFPAAYGNRLSSVLDVRSAEEGRPGMHGTANVSLIASTASLGSTSEDGNRTWMVGARRTYIDKMVGLLTPNELP